MIFAIEPFGSAIDDAIPLLNAHYEEIAWAKDRIPLDVDFKTYFKMVEAGILKVFTARDGGKMVGYSAYFVNTSPHYASTLYAVNDVIYISPSHRGITGSKFIDYCERELKSLNVQVITYHIKTSLDWSSMLKRKGYEWMEKLMVKWIGD